MKFLALNYICTAEIETGKPICILTGLQKPNIRTTVLNVPSFIIKSSEAIWIYNNHTREIEMKWVAFMIIS